MLESFIRNFHISQTNATQALISHCEPAFTDVVCQGIHLRIITCIVHQRLPIVTEVLWHKTKSQFQLKLHVGQDEKVTACDNLQNIRGKVPRCTLSIHSKYAFLFQILSTGHIGVLNSFDRLASATVTLGGLQGAKLEVAFDP